ncbi:MAG: alpha/beta hydrolase family protein [Stenotrophobium sp.]
MPELLRERAISITCGDGYPLAARVLEPKSSPLACVVIAGALGVPARFYAAYACFLAEQGFVALTFDYRGSGDSVRGQQRGRNIRMQDWGRLDIEAVLVWTRREFRAEKTYLVGHSAGGQLPGLAPNSENLSGLILVAASAPHLRHYPLRSWPMLIQMWYGLAPLLSLGRDDFPTRQTGLGSTRVAAGTVAQWARWARSRDYMFTEKNGIDATRYARLKIPLLSFCFADDTYATAEAVNALLAHYSAATIENRLVPKPSNGVIGHFGYFRDQQRQTLWQDTACWLMHHAH